MYTNILFPKVWSMVALIYNNWIIYLPTSAEQEEGLLETPVMCSTTRWVGESGAGAGAGVGAGAPGDTCYVLYYKMGW